MKRTIFCLIYFFILTLAADCQIVNGNAFIRGNFLEVGINQCGGFGTTANAPAGYHARSGISPRSAGDGQLNLGCIADPARDGWTVGTPNYHGDYFMPDDPHLGWGIVFNGNRYGTQRITSSSTICGFPILSPLTPSFLGSNISVATTSSGMQAIWQGSNNGLQLRKTFTLSHSELYFVIRVELKNATSSPMTGVYYGEFVNPDNDAYQNDLLTSDLETANAIVNQSTVDNQALVQAIGIPTNTYLGLGSRDCRARVFRGRYVQNPSGTFSNLATYPLSGPDEWFIESPASYLSITGVDPATGGNVYRRDGCIGIVFNIGTIAPGDSTSFVYTYILNAADFASALTETNPGFTDNINLYNSGAVLTPCANSTIDLKIINGDYNTWTWSPATGLNTTNGINVSATVGSNPITYTASSVGSCGNRTVTVVIQPAPTPALGPDQNIGACIGSNTNLTTLFNTTGASTNWTSGGSPVNNPLAVGPGTYQLIALNPNGCSDTALVNITSIPKPNLGPDISTGICSGNTADLTTQFVTTGLTLQWSSGGNPVNNPSAVGAGIFQLIAANSNGCTDTALVTVNLSTAVNLRITSNPTNPTIIEGERIQLSAIGNNISSCRWQPSLYLSADIGVNISATPLTSISYQAIAVNSQGCSDTAAINIDVLPFELDVSAAFTPNADGYTDRWVIRNIQFAKQHKVIVFNRWGNKIFESNNYQNNWDGTHNGIPVPVGAYYYVVEVITATDKRVIKKGSLTILR